MQIWQRMREYKLSAWEEAYRSVESLWGLKPDHVLVDYGSLVPKGSVLDLGMGEGRNSFFFAKMGYEVEGYDISQTAIERCIERAKNENLKVKAEVKDLREVDIPKGRYSLIIAAWVLNFFKKTEAEEIIRKIKEGLKDLLKDVDKMPEGERRTTSLWVLTLFNNWNQNVIMLSTIVANLITDMNLYVETLEKYSTELDNTLTEIFEKAEKIAEERRKQQEEQRKEEPS